jgi:hypothetical protein
MNTAIRRIHIGLSSRNSVRVPARHQDGSTSVLGLYRPDERQSREKISIQPTRTEFLELKPMWIRRIQCCHRTESNRSEPNQAQDSVRQASDQFGSVRQGGWIGLI